MSKKSYFLIQKSLSLKRYSKSTTIVIMKLSKVPALIFQFMLSMLFPVLAEAESVTMNVGDSKTLYPSILPTLTLAGQPAWISNNPDVVQVYSFNMYSCTIKALKPSDRPVIVQCSYYYRVLNGSYVYQLQGAVDYEVTVESIKPQSISVYPTNVTIDIGDTRTMEINVFPSNADKSVTWSSTDNTVAYVHGDNMLEAFGKGTATVTATTPNGLHASCEVTVIHIEPTSVSLPAEISLIEGKYTSLKAELLPAGATSHLTWKSADEEIAEVTTSGGVIAVSPGTTTVTVKTSNGLTAACKVIVKENPGPPKSISLPEGMSLIYGFYTTLVPEFTPADADATCTWSSSAPTVVSVDNSGTVKALKKSGEAVITVRTENGLTAECRITAVDSVLDIPADDIKAAFTDIWRLENYTLKLF